MQTATIYVAVVLLLLAPGRVFGQQAPIHEKVGEPYTFQTYVDEEVIDRNENWSIAQSSNGLIYIANHGGVLEFDGHVWRLIRLPNHNNTFSIDIDEQDVVYVGARGDFGYLSVDSTYSMRFVSLLEHVPEEHRDFLAVWGTHVTSDAVFFHTWRYLFKWDGTSITTWESETRLHTSFKVGDRVFVKQDSVALLEVVGEELLPIRDGERFALPRVFMMESLKDGAILIGAQSDIDGPLELYRYSDLGIERMPTDPHLLNATYEYTFYHGARLGDDYYAIATLYDGAFIVDYEGNLVGALGPHRGVPGDLTHVFSDREGSLWLAHYTNGITHVGTPLALSKYISPGKSINAVQRHEGRLYVATDEGLYKLNSELAYQDEAVWDGFELVEVEPNTQVRWAILPYDDELLVTTEVGVFSLRNGTSTHVAFDRVNKPKYLYASRYFENRVYVGLENGLGIMTRTSSGWEVENKPGTVHLPVTSMAEDEEGVLWVATTSAKNQVWRLKFDEEGRLKKEEWITERAELEVRDLMVGRFGGEIGIIAAPKGIYRFEAQSTSGLNVALDERLIPPGSFADSIASIHPINDRTFYVEYGDQLVLNTIKEDGRVKQHVSEALGIPDWKGVGDFWIDPDGVTWIAHGNTLIRYNPAYDHTIPSVSALNPMIRSASIVWTDSLLYGGAAPSGLLSSESASPVSVVLGHDDNDLQFEYALPDFNRKEKIQYQHFLKGHDEGWSSWSAEGRVNYRNVAPGDLEFLVRARVGNRVLDHVAAFPFIIRPPWYATWWMRVTYGFLLILPGILIVRYINAQRRLKELEKEREIYERLNHANEQLRVANSSLEEANKMKDEFLANASHELRTPLTAILGFTSVLKEEVSGEHTEFLGLIDENGKRLLKTINSLLDLAKLRAGMVELDLQLMEINQKSEEVVELLAQLAKNRNINLLMKKSPQKVYVPLDDHSFERIMYNLVGNAIKFTPRGSVIVEVEPVDDKVFVHVHDTGVGIDEKFLPHLFDEFKQEPSNSVRSDGSGLGLTITAKLVSLMHGEISVKSEKGVGSTFTVVFPIEQVRESNGRVDQEVTSRAPA